jgi:uncharacterized protein (TIGR03083 family)
VDHARCCDLLAEEVERVAGVVAEVPADARVPSCPDWNVGELALHLGRVHRWADGLVGTLADGPQAAADAFEDLGPPTAAWLRSGGTTLVGTLRAADPDAAMWAWGADQHVRFWSRRQLHETLVHRIDAELAGGLVSTASSEVAADAIDELLMNLPMAARFSPKVANLHGDGRRLALVPSDAEEAWTITLGTDGFAVGARSTTAEATLSGPALALLLVLYRRRALEGSGLTVSGDQALVDLWLDNSALE